MNKKIIFTAFLGLVLTGAFTTAAFADVQNPGLQVQIDQQQQPINQDNRFTTDPQALPRANTDLYGFNEANVDQNRFFDSKNAFLGFATDMSEDQVKEALRADPNLSAFADKIGVINCNGQTFVFGAVDSDTIRQGIIAKIRGMDSTSNIQDKIIVVVK